MIAFNKQSVQKKQIKLLPQETEGNYTFTGNFVSTPAAIEKFGHEIIVAAHIILMRKAKQTGGLDYLQVFEVDGQRLWFIDDESHVTALLPSDY